MAVAGKNSPGPGQDDAIGLAFSSASRGYLVLSRFGDDARGYLLRTSDGGRTWRPQLVTSAPLRPGRRRREGNHRLRLCTDGSLFFTTSGGDEGGPSTVKLSTSRRRLSGARTIRVAGRVRGAAAGSRVLVARRFRGESAGTTGSRESEPTARSGPPGASPGRPPSWPSGSATTTRPGTARAQSRCTCGAEHPPPSRKPVSLRRRAAEPDAASARGSRRAAA